MSDVLAAAMLMKAAIRKRTHLMECREPAICPHPSHKPKEPDVKTAPEGSIPLFKVLIICADLAEVKALKTQFIVQESLRRDMSVEAGESPFEVEGRCDDMGDIMFTYADATQTRYTFVTKFNPMLRRGTTDPARILKTGRFHAFRTAAWLAARLAAGENLTPPAGADVDIPAEAEVEE